MRKTRTQRWAGSLLALAILVSAAQVLLRAGDGDLDPTFGDGGKVKTNFFEGFSNEDIQDIVIQPDGKIVAVGSASGIKRVPVFAIARYNTNGSLDATFGLGGRVLTQVSEGSRATGVALQPDDGKIVVIGNASNVSGPSTLQDFVVARYNTDGSLDTTFGKTGVVATDFGRTIDNAKDVLIDDNGAIVVVGGQFLRGRNIEIARYNRDGTLDKSFGAGGTLVLDLGIDAQAVAQQIDGRLVVAGSSVGSEAVGDTNFVLVRLEPDGSLDASFGNGGAVATDFQQGGDSVSNLLIQPDGRIIATGTVGVKGNTLTMFGLARYLPDGTLDPSFGDGGRVITGLGFGDDLGADSSLESDGRIVFIGTSREEFAIVRYEGDGAIDPTFGTDGVVRVDFSTPTQPETSDHARAVAIQADGRIVVGGTSIDVSAQTSDAALLRINPQQ